MVHDTTVMGIVIRILLFFGLVCSMSKFCDGTQDEGKKHVCPAGDVFDYEMKRCVSCSMCEKFPDSMFCADCDTDFGKSYKSCLNTYHAAGIGFY